jgi:hypothetical protein
MTHWVGLGTTLTLGALAEDSQAGAQFVWVKDGERLEGMSEPLLLVRGAGHKDEGEYAVYLSKRRDRGAGAEKLELLGVTRVRIAQPPVLMPKPRLRTSLAPGAMLALAVSARGLPPPFFQWRLNGVPVPGATRSSLIVRSVNATHAGTYTCDAYNMAGQVTWEEGVVLIEGGASSGQFRWS